MHKIYVISVGPGNKDYVTPAANKTVKICDVIIGMDYQVEAVDISHNQQVIIQSDINSILDLIDKNIDKKIGVLVTGDAGIFSLSRLIMEKFGRESVVEVVPGISSIQTAFARVKETWYNAKIYSFHGREIEGISEILGQERVAILCGSNNDSKIVLLELVKAGLFNKNRVIYVCQNLTFNDESITLIKNESDIQKIQKARREIILFYDDKI